MNIGYLMQEGPARLDSKPLSGPSVHVRQVIAELTRQGHRVRLLAKFDNQLWLYETPDHRRPVSVSWLERSPLRLLESVVRRLQTMLGLPYLALFDALHFAAACHQELSDCDLYYERFGWMGYGGALAARRTGIPLLLEVNGDIVTELETLGMYPRGLQRYLSLGLMRRAAQAAVRVVSAGDGWAKRFAQRWQVDPARIDSVENGSELVNLLCRDRLQTFQPDFAEGKPVTMVFIGGFQPWQGLPILLDAMAQAVTRGAEVRLTIIGGGQEQADLEQQAARLNLSPLIDFLGQMSAADFATHLAQAEIGLSPYCGRVEFSGLKLLDYKAAGLAVIASGQHGEPAILEHRRSGWIVPPCNPEMLAEAIVTLAADPDLRRAIGRQARLEAEQSHGWQHTAQNLDTIFNQVISSHDQQLQPA